MKTNKLVLSAALASAVLLSTAGIAGAHVSVFPKESKTDAYEKYSVRVPVEKDQATTKVRLEFPEGVKVSTVEPEPGWTYEFAKDSEGRFTGITWTAQGDGIKPHEFAEFAFVGKNPSAATSLAWKAYQTYADGTVVEWTGDKESKTPASVTAIAQATAGADHHGGTESTGHGAAAQAESTAAQTTTAESNTLPLILSGLALLLSAISLFRKRA